MDLARRGLHLLEASDDVGEGRRNFPRKRESSNAFHGRIGEKRISHEKGLHRFSLMICKLSTLVKAVNGAQHAIIGVQHPLRRQSLRSLPAQRLASLALPQALSLAQLPRVSISRSSLPTLPTLPPFHPSTLCPRLKHPLRRQSLRSLPAQRLASLALQQALSLAQLPLVSINRLKPPHPSTLRKGAIHVADNPLKMGP